MGLEQTWQIWEIESKVGGGVVMEYYIHQISWSGLHSIATTCQASISIVSAAIELPFPPFPSLPFPLPFPFPSFPSRPFPSLPVPSRPVPSLPQFVSVCRHNSGVGMCVFQLASMILPDDENFLLLFRRETPLDNSVEFMRIWRSYDADSSGFISAGELKDFLRDLFLQHNKVVTEVKLEEYTDTMMKIFDKNKDGRLDLNDLARILALQENFLLQFKMDACSTEERRRDFEKIFAHYDVSKTGALEGPEVDGFVKDMMELVKPSISGVDLDKFRQILLNHCDVNRDGKIQKSELALCLGLKMNP
uniref:Secretagogin n=2 Tax=Phasianidae TaxID=9005 RepID=A0A8C2T3G9_COTJA